MSDAPTRVLLHRVVTGNGPDVVLIHALGLSHAIWTEHAERLERDFRVTRVDVRGHGASEKPAGPYRIEDMAEDVRAVMDEEGVERAILAGVSLGGMISLALALAHPARVRGLVLTDTTAGYGPDGKDAREQRARAAETGGMAPLVDNTLDRFFTPGFRQAHPDLWVRTRRLLLANDPRAYAATLRAIANLDLAARLGEIRCPTVVLVGEGDTSTPPFMSEALHRGIRGSRYEVIPNARHLSPVEVPGPFERAIREVAAASGK